MASLTLGDLIAQSLRKAGVIRENQNPSASQERDAIDTFNGMMAQLAADDVDLGDYPVSAVADELELEREHKEPVRVLLAVALQADHGMPVDPQLQAQAASAMRFLERNTFIKPDVDLSLQPLGRANSPRYDINSG